jgi:hypothetical protein
LHWRVTCGLGHRGAGGFEGWSGAWRSHYRRAYLENERAVKVFRNGRPTIMRWISAPRTSDGGSIALAVLRYLRQSVSPRPALIILPLISAPVHSRNTHRQAVGRCGRARQDKRAVPRQTRAAGSGGASFQDTIKRASKTTARIRSSKKAAKITVSRMVPQSDPVSDALSPRSFAPCFKYLALAADKLSHHLTDAVPILHTRAPVSAPAL